MSYKYILLVVSFYFISVFQSSFLPHFAILGVTPNLLLVLVCLITFLSDHRSYAGIISAVSAGIFLDLLGGSFIGASIVAMVCVYFFIKNGLVYLIDFSKEFSILYFMPILALGTIIYGFIVNILIYFSVHSIFLYFSSWAILVDVLFSVILGVIGFYVFRIISKAKHGF